MNGAITLFIIRDDQNRTFSEHRTEGGALGP